MHIHSLANSLKIPYISIKWNSLEEEQVILNNLNQIYDDEPVQLNHVNIHPPAHKLVKGIIDLIDYYKWDYVTILYQESIGLARIEDLIKLPTRPNYGAPMKPGNMNSNKLRVQVRQLSSDISQWIYVIKEVKLTGSSHIIVDIQTKYLNKFLEHVNFIQIFDYHFIFNFKNSDVILMKQHF